MRVLLINWITRTLYKIIQLYTTSTNLLEMDRSPTEFPGAAHTFCNATIELHWPPTIQSSATSPGRPPIFPPGTLTVPVNTSRKYFPENLPRVVCDSVAGPETPTWMSRLS